jgi:hypothetical protein
MDKVQKPSNTNRNIPSLEPFMRKSSWGGGGGKKKKKNHKKFAIKKN